MANRLKEFRKENKITQNKLSELLKTSQSTIADYERGKNYLPTPFLYTISKKYGISADYLFHCCDPDQPDGHYPDGGGRPGADRYL